MKNKNIKLIIPSVLAIIGSIAISTGTTYSLFTSESTNNITISSGKVDVTSTLSNLKTSSKESENGDYVEQSNGSFYLGGSASISSDGASLNINNIAPGDKVEFDIKIENKGNISTQYQYSYSLDSDASLSAKKLLASFNVTSKIDNESDKELIGSSHKYISYSSGYSLLAIDASKTIHFTFELPIELSDSELMGVTDLKLNFKVEATQGNTSVSSEEKHTDYVSYSVNDVSSFTNALTTNTNEVKEVTLTSDITLSSKLSSLTSDAVIDLNGKTLSSSYTEGNNKASNPLLVGSGNSEVILNNGTLETTGQYSSSAAVFGNSNIVANNVKFISSSGFGFASNGKDSRTSQGTFTNCEFKSTSGIALYLPAGDFTFNNCSINGFSVICGGSHEFNNTSFNFSFTSNIKTQKENSGYYNYYGWQDKSTTNYFTDYDAYYCLKNKISNGAVSLFDPILVIDNRSSFSELSSLKFTDCTVDYTNKTTTEYIFGLRYVDMNQTLTSGSNFTFNNTKLDFSGLSWANEAHKDGSNKDLLTSYSYFNSSSN